MWYLYFVHHTSVVYIQELANYLCLFVTLQFKLITSRIDSQKYCSVFCVKHSRTFSRGNLILWKLQHKKHGVDETDKPIELKCKLGNVVLYNKIPVFILNFELKNYNFIITENLTPYSLLLRMKGNGLVLFVGLLEKFLV